MTRFRSASLRSLALALAAFACVPPASADADSRLRVFGYTRAMPVETVPDSVIDDWKYLDDRNVMVVRNGRSYLLVLTSSCPALQSAGVIGFNAALSGLVASKTLVVGSRSSSTECGVDQIVQLDRLPPSQTQTTAPAPPPRRAPPARAATPAPTPTPAPAPARAPAAAPPPPPPPPAETTPTPTPPPLPPADESPAAPPPPRLNDHPVATPPGATPL